MQAGGADDLLDHLLGVLLLVGPGRGRDEDDAVDVLVELLEVQRPVVQRARQAEAVLDQRLLAREVAEEHAAHLRHGDVRLVDEQQPVVREVVEQRPGRRAGVAARAGGASSSRCRSSSRPRASLSMS